MMSTLSMQGSVRMRAGSARVGAVLTMSAVMTAGLGLLASPASAQESGLTF
ncbi:hypothetical protein FHU34_115677 [Micromonospora taraxaci]|uniref:Uncharacterized protein n=1 Tax=Micromonospora taraxaci TaxID=1316803 RepID=A0A561W8V7_9ACTN|nr:hypothetical protein FHU34_115677 [Micromonospora taraxaci]